MLRTGALRRWSEEHRPQLLAGLVVFAALVGAAILVFRPGDRASAGVDLADPHAWIEHGLDGELLQVNAATQEVTARLDIAEPGARLAVVPHGDGAAVLDTDSGLLTLVSGRRLEVTGQVPLELTTEPDLRNLGLFGSPDPQADVVVIDSDQVLSIDPQTRLVNTIPLAEPLLSVAQRGDGQLLALSSDSEAVLLLDNGSLDLIAELAPPLAGSSEGRQLVSAGGDVYALDPARLWAARVLDPALLDAPMCMTSAANGAVAGGSGPTDAAMIVGYNTRNTTLALAGPQTGCIDIDAEIASDSIGEPIAHRGHVYVPDYATGRIHVIDLDSERVIARLPFGSNGQPFDLEVIGTTVWANEPQGRFAAVVEAGTITPVAKISSIVAGATEIAAEGDGEALAPGDVDGSGLRIIGDSGDEVLAVGETGDVPTIGAGPGGLDDDELSLEPVADGEPVTASGVGISIDAAPQPSPEPAIEPQLAVEPEAPDDADRIDLIANFGVSSSTAVVGEILRFTDFSSGSPTSWTWDFGDGTGSDEPNVEKSWDAAGVYLVQLTVTRGGESSTQTTEISIVPETVVIAPTADFSFDRNTIEEGESVTFTSRTVGEPDALSWSFGDGNGATGESVTHTFGRAGTYTVTLTATNTAGSTTASTTITVLEGVKEPQAVIGPIPSDIVNGQFVTLRSNSLNEPTSFSWDFGDGTRASGESVRHKWDTPGTYRVRLEVANSKGADASFVDVRVAKRVDPPVAQFAQSATEVLVDQAVSFTDLSLNDPTKLIWEFGDGTASNSATPTKSWSEPGRYRVTLRATNDAGTNRTGVTIRVIKPVDPPVAAFRAGTLVAAVGEAISFQDTSANVPTNWSWDFGDSSTSTLTSTTHAYAQPGTYRVRLTVTNEGGTSSTDQVIEIKEKPSANFRWEANGRTVKFTDTSWDGPEQWRWDFGDGTTSDRRSPEHTFARGGRYDVTLVVSNEVGSSAPKTQTVVVTRPPVAEATCTVVGRSVECDGSASRNAASYRWVVPDAVVNTTPNAATTTLAFGARGRYDVTLVVTSADGETDRTTIRTPDVRAGLRPRVSDVDVVSVEGGLVRLEATFDRGPTSWSWEVGGAELVEGGNTPTPLFRVTGNGLYLGRVEASNVFGSDSDEFGFRIDSFRTEASFTWTVIEPGRIRFENTSTSRPDALVTWATGADVEVLRNDNEAYVLRYGPGVERITVRLTVADLNGIDSVRQGVDVPPIGGDDPDPPDGDGGGAIDVPEPEPEPDPEPAPGG